jgi:hypothetical protein
MAKEFCTTCDKVVTNEDLAYCKSNRHEIIDMLEDYEAIDRSELINFASNSEILHERIPMLETDIKKRRITQKTDKKPIKKAKGTISEYFVESILVDGNPLFLCVHKPSNKLILLDNIESNEFIVKPIEEHESGYFPYSFTKEEIDSLISTKLSKEELLDLVKKQINKFINASEIDKHLILGDILLSYCQEWINTIHYLYFVGETESGKSSCLHLFKWLGYRCLYSDGLPNADIYNFLGTEEEGAGMIAEDEAQSLEYNKDKISTYKNSYSRGSLKPRIITTSNTKKQVFYKTFCLKVFAGEKIPYDKGLLERLAIVHMLEGLTESNIKRLSTQEKDELIHLRNLLLVWKVQNFTQALEPIKSGLTQRDQELWEDFLSVVAGTKYFDECKSTVITYTTQRHNAIKNSLEARVLKLTIEQILNNIIKRRKKEPEYYQLEVLFVILWDYLINDNPELPGRLDEKQAKFYPDNFGKITKNSLSRLLQDKFQAMPIERYVKEEDEEKYHKKTYYSFKIDVLSKLIMKYGIEIPKDSLLFSGLSGTSGQIIQESLDHLDHLDHPKDAQNDV